jgi:uncharacterized protein
MISPSFDSYTSFDGYSRIASGPLRTVALAVKRAIESGTVGPILTFEDATGRLIDVDTESTEQAALAHLTLKEAADSSPDSHVETHRERGRPKLGVVAREITLLPRHWEWLATQPGGASVTLRKLVDEARRANVAKDKTRNAQERAYRFMSALAGNLDDFEEASRALFANNRQRFIENLASWPGDVRDYAIQLAFGDDNPISS